MKPTFLSSLLAVVMLAWGPPSQAQDCSTEVLATLTTQMWGGEISYTISDDNGSDGDGTASLGDSSASQWTLELFPNPGQDQLTIRSQHSGTDTAPTVVVFNADGRMVMDATNDTRGVDGDWILDATSWTPGMYIVHVTQFGTTRQLPWIKVR